jgi:DNA-binding GntR family transcriptional regulator
MRRAVPRITAESLDEAAALQHAMEDEATVARWAELNRRFHRIFHEASGSTRLSETVSNLQDSYAAYIVSSIVRDPQRRAESDKEHWAILDAARHADVDAAIERILQHIRAPLEHVDSRA